MFTYVSSSDLFVFATKSKNGEKMNFTEKYKGQRKIYNLPHANRQKHYCTLVLALYNKKLNFATIGVLNSLAPDTKY